MGLISKILFFAVILLLIILAALRFFFMATKPNSEPEEPQMFPTMEEEITSFMVNERGEIEYNPLENMR